MNQQDCTFCNRRFFEAYILKEFEYFFILFSAKPFTKGPSTDQLTKAHYLIVSKEHRDSMGDFSQEEWSEFSVVVRYLEERMESSYKVIFNSDKAAGREIGHFHLGYIEWDPNVMIGLGRTDGGKREELIDPDEVDPFRRKF